MNLDPNAPASTLTVRAEIAPGINAPSGWFNLSEKDTIKSGDMFMNAKGKFEITGLAGFEANHYYIRRVSK